MALQGFLFSFFGSFSKEKRRDLTNIIKDYGGEVAYLGKVNATTGYHVTF